MNLRLAPDHPRSSAGDHASFRLIARAFEDDDPNLLLGLAECTEPELALRALPIQSITSPTSLPNGTSTAATSHGALDDDRVVVERVVGNVRSS